MSERKKQEKSVQGPLFEFPTVDELIAAPRSLRDNNGYQLSNTIQWSDPTYVTLSSIGELYFGMIPSFETAEGAKYPSWVDTYARSLDLTRYKFIKSLWTSKAYGQLARYTNTGTSSRPTIEHMEAGFETFVNNRNYDRYAVALPSRCTNGTIADVINRMKYGQGLSAICIPSKVVKTGEFATSVYIASRYSLIYCPRMVVNRSLQSHLNSFAMSIESMYALVPLMNVVVKWTDAPVIRASWLTGEGIDPSMLELWVDKSLESEDSPHPIRTQYIRAIRNPLAKLGIKIVVKDDLRAEHYSAQVIPKFKLLSEEKEWAAKWVQEALNDDRLSYGIARRPMKAV